MSSLIDSRFQKVNTEGQGGFSIADLYFDTNLERHVIIKKLQEFSEVDRLLDEIEALQKGKSKHLVQIYDIIFDEDRPVAIVEEYLPGNDLLNFNHTPSDTQIYLKVLYQLAKGLSDIHECEIVHRDFKPNNVKFDSEKILKIFDFGLAKNEIPASTVGQIGTPGFMAPELFWSPPVIDRPVDCYSFGCTAYYLVSKKPPQCSLSMPPVAKQSSESINNYINIDNNELLSLIDQCLEIDPSNRPTMKEIYESLKKELLYGKYKATLTFDGKTLELNEIDSGVKVSGGNNDSAVIRYDGYNFIATEVNGNVYVNNTKIDTNFYFCGSAVITLGHPDLKAFRRYITFDISNPEVVL
ncbi:serine/threonine-protein kinase [Desulfobacula phenolica]|uniref:Serine/threonine protein kinase n=1 Tax=Desulfobacula phenolica TaxID=90732 RepID=A0A1H2ID82_9BACT|nr:serine/threonine-protein kinase [Desulfobacula phenolica]SDU42033.1 serine/threonine protein kinase [Desulfobacula phenolica]